MVAINRELFSAVKQGDLAYVQGADLTPYNLNCVNAQGLTLHIYNVLMSLASKKTRRKSCTFVF